MVRVALVREAGAKIRIVNAADAVQVARQVIGDADRETFLVLLLDTKLFVTAGHIAAVGSLDHCLLHPREVFKAAVVANAASVVIAHNHPSGDPTPSPEDRAMTRRLWRAGELLGIAVQDHVIVGHGRVHSFRAEGDMPASGRSGVGAGPSRAVASPSDEDGRS